MPEEFEGDLAGAVFWGADLTGACFRDVNLTDARISHAWLVNVDIDALVDKVVINGVDLTAVVLRPDAATSRLRDGQGVHGADPRSRLPPDRVAQQWLRRLPVARPR
jgi:hypothetical protein